MDDNHNFYSCTYMGNSVENKLIYLSETLGDNGRLLMFLNSMSSLDDNKNNRQNSLEILDALLIVGMTVENSSHG